MTDTEAPMLDNADAVRNLLRQHAVFPAEEPVEVTFLPGGVSSIVAQADSRANRVVLKQALPQLKVQDEWLSRVERCLIEARCVQALTELVPGSGLRRGHRLRARGTFSSTCLNRASPAYEDVRFLTLVAGPRLRPMF